MMMVSHLILLILIFGYITMIFSMDRTKAETRKKGDGSVDVKGKSTYVTVSYNHFFDSGKCSLCGMHQDSNTGEFFVTYHHNWFDHSDSRHPRIRVGTIHIYNNYFDGKRKVWSWYYNRRFSIC